MSPRFRILFVLAFISLINNYSLAATVKTVSVEYVYQVPENVSLDKAKQIALSRAQMQAVADEFGTLISQSNLTSIKTEGENSYAGFMSLGGSELKGEWIETVGTPTYEIITQGNSLAIRVNVKGKIREIEENKISFSLEVLRNGTDATNESRKFNSGDAMYMSFRSPANGYLAIYLLDASNEAYCLLPYSSQTTGYYAAEANKKHILFSRNHANDKEREYVDELIMDTDLASEDNRLIVIFSPNRFFKAVDSKIEECLPSHLGYDDFVKWLSDIKKRDTQLSIKEEIITISKK